MAVIKGRSPNTVNSYYGDLKLFLRFLKQKNNLVSDDLTFEEITINDLSENIVKNVTLYDAMEFLHFMSSERNNSAKARTRRAVAIKQFYKYLTYNKMWFNVSPLDRLELPSLKKTLPKHLTIEQAIKLLESKASTKNWQDSRDFCIITLFLNCGMRLNELVNLNFNDYTHTKDIESDNEINSIKVTGKGNKERIIYLNQACVNAYNNYKNDRDNLVLKNERLKKENALFLSKQYRRISDRRVQQIIEEALKTTGLDNMGFSVHKLRHTAATLMYQNGVDVRVLKEVLGHENLDTTQIYTHVANQQLKQAVDKNPLAKGVEIKTNNIKEETE